MTTLRLKQKQAQQQQKNSKSKTPTTPSPTTSIEGSQTPSAATKKHKHGRQNISTYQQIQDFHYQHNRPTELHNVYQQGISRRCHVSQHRASSEPIQPDHQAPQPPKDEYKTPTKSKATSAILSVKT